MGKESINKVITVRNVTGIKIRDVDPLAGGKHGASQLNR